MSDTKYSRIGVEKHRELKENSEIKFALFACLKKLDLVDHGTWFSVNIDQLLNKVDMSGEIWDDA